MCVRVCGGIVLRGSAHTCEGLCIHISACSVIDSSHRLHCWRNQFSPPPPPHLSSLTSRLLRPFLFLISGCSSRTARASPPTYSALLELELPQEARPRAAVGMWAPKRWPLRPCGNRSVRRGTAAEWWRTPIPNPTARTPLSCSGIRLEGWWCCCCCC